MPAKKKDAGATATAAPKKDESVSKKHKEFISSPMAGKPVNSLPGIGDTAAKHLIDKGFKKAEDVYGKFLSVKRDKKKFTDWLRQFGGTDARLDECYQALQSWYDAHM